MTPTKDPLTELAARLAASAARTLSRSATGWPGTRTRRTWPSGRRSWPPRPAVKRSRRRPMTALARLVLIVDQFEQVFTLNPEPGGEATRQAFITALCSAATNPVGPGQEPPALVVIAVRGDFWDRCAAVPELVSALQDGQFVVGPMTESELRVAITGPAEAAGLRIDPALTDTILGDLRAAGADRSAGVLPLLSQAMALTWEQREGDRLTSHGYAQAGGVSHAVQTGADRVYDALSAGQQAVARDVLRSMTVASRDGSLARRPVSRDDLYTGLPGAARADIDAVLDAFAAERLAVLDGDTAQLSHDVLLRAWPRLRGGWRRTRPAGSCTASSLMPPPPGTTAMMIRPSYTGGLSSPRSSRLLPVVGQSGALPGPHRHPARLPAGQRAGRRPQQPPAAERLCCPCPADRAGAGGLGRRLLSACGRSPAT